MNNPGRTLFPHLELSLVPNDEPLEAPLGIVDFKMLIALKQRTHGGKPRCEAAASAGSIQQELEAIAELAEELAQSCQAAQSSSARSGPSGRSYPSIAVRFLR